MTMDVPERDEPGEDAEFVDDAVDDDEPGRLPGFWRTDLSAFKNIKFTERLSGQFRVDASNVFNHLNPICCASFTTSNSNYNKIRDARDPRIMQLAFKLSF